MRLIIVLGSSPGPALKRKFVDCLSLSQSLKALLPRLKVGGFHLNFNGNARAGPELTTPAVVCPCFARAETYIVPCPKESANYEHAANKSDYAP